MIETAIVILVWNGKKFLSQFLPSIIEHSEKAKVMVVDNGSTDHSDSFVQSHFPSVEIIKTGANLGFSQGYNVALKNIQARYYVILNADVKVTPGWLTPLLRRLNENPHIAAVQPKILSYHQPHYFEYAGAAGGYVDVLAYPFCRGRLFHHLEEDHGQYNDSRPIFWATGACLVIRSNCFHQVGGFNKHFFAHMEEIDLCWKLHRAGYSIYYEGKSHVFHVGGGNLNNTHPVKAYLNFRNGLSLLWRHSSARNLIWKFPIRIVLDHVAALLFIVSGEGKKALMIWKAHLNFISGWNRELNSRSQLKKELPRFSADKQYKGSIVWDVFVRRIKTFSELNIFSFSDTKK